MVSSFKVSVEANPDTEEEMAPLLAKEVGIFNKWLMASGHDPLLRIEEAMLRTYLVQKFRGRLSGTPS